MVKFLLRPPVAAPDSRLKPKCSPLVLEDFSEFPYFCRDLPRLRGCHGRNTAAEQAPDRAPMSKADPDADLLQAAHGPSLQNPDRIVGRRDEAVVEKAESERGSRDTGRRIFPVAG